MKGLLGLVLWSVAYGSADAARVVGCNLRRASADGNSGDVIGYVRFTEDYRQSPVLTQVEVKITNGTQVNETLIRAFHIHADNKTSNSCVAAGGHWNPNNYSHSCQDDNKPGAPRHAGDIGNIQMNSDYTAWQIFNNDNLENRFDELAGHAVVLHTAEDDCKTQPTGNAGGRMACCLLEVEDVRPDCTDAASHQVGFYGTYPVDLPAAGEEFELVIVGNCLSAGDRYGLSSDKECRNVELRTVEERELNAIRSIVTTIARVPSSEEWQVCYSVGGIQPPTPLRKSNHPTGH